MPDFEDLTVGTDRFDNLEGCFLVDRASRRCWRLDRYLGKFGGSPHFLVGAVDWLATPLPPQQVTPMPPACRFPVDMRKTFLRYPFVLRAGEAEESCIIPGDAALELFFANIRSGSA